MSESKASQSFDVAGYSIWAMSLLLRVFVVVPALVLFVGIVASNDFSAAAIVDGLVTMLRPDNIDRTQEAVNQSVAGLLTSVYWMIVIFYSMAGVIFGLFEAPPATGKGDQ